MNRLSPLIVRRTGRNAPAAALALPLPRAAAAALPAPQSDELRQVGITFLAGLVFFSAYIA
jgi:hypothetical protein